MRILLLGSPTSWYTHDLLRATPQGDTLEAVNYLQLQSLQSNSKVWHQAGTTNLALADCLLIRSMPPGSLEQVVFRMDVLGQLHKGGLPIVNSPRAIETAVDKYLATARLQNAGLKVPKTIVCQTVEEAMTAFLELGKDIVVKPLFGSEGRGLLRVSDEGLAWRTFQTLARTDRVLYLQQFIDHPGHDLRLLVVGERVLGMRRKHANDWRTNISRGAVPESLLVTSQLEELARKSADAVGATLAGVDLLPDRDGQLFALEVNAVPGWRALADTTQTDVSHLVIEHLRQMVL